MIVYELKILSGGCEGDDGKFYARDEVVTTKTPWHKTRPEQFLLVKEIDDTAPTETTKVPDGLVDATDEFDLGDVTDIMIKRKGYQFWVFDLRESADVPCNTIAIRKKEVTGFVDSLRCEEE